ncbi:hypothetical protein L202_04036 [Cryptococcus amylolentus CBS 6039]|uniref:Uncharacterized protein n=2 Tax=Cryptococcus amylolentus TaxID=104669 RepID=A0A1E3HPZ1_9TREE|nr:hypothetical protein L202_04036 [Cryptococcus amylolentus CBS 6039]ODN78397.1 hypothetical protein L202_04036 [Cryptococcus amylolentus CBS 6039]
MSKDLTRFYNTTKYNLCDRVDPKDYIQLQTEEVEEALPTSSTNKGEPALEDVLATAQLESINVELMAAAVGIEKEVRTLRGMKRDISDIPRQLERYRTHKDHLEQLDAEETGTEIFEAIRGRGHSEQRPLNQAIKLASQQIRNMEAKLSALENEREELEKRSNQDPAGEDSTDNDDLEGGWEEPERPGDLEDDKDDADDDED